MMSLIKSPTEKKWSEKEKENCSDSWIQLHVKLTLSTSWLHAPICSDLLKQVQVHITFQEAWLRTPGNPLYKELFRDRVKLHLEKWGWIVTEVEQKNSLQTCPGLECGRTRSLVLPPSRKPRPRAIMAVAEQGWDRRTDLSLTKPRCLL